MYGLKNEQREAINRSFSFPTWGMIMATSLMACMLQQADGAEPAL